MSYVLETLEVLEISEMVADISNVSKVYRISKVYKRSEVSEQRKTFWPACQDLGISDILDTLGILEILET